jgi:hypothetical protein
MNDAANILIREWLASRSSGEARSWLYGQIEKVLADQGDRALQIAFGLIPRRLGKASMNLTAEELDSARTAVDGWSPLSWTVADAARALLLSSLPGRNPDFAPRFRALCETAEVSESISLYRGLPLYPEPESLESQVGEGLRSNMRDVFEAIAHHNPYPRQYFDTHRWNHMVLKALFVGSALAPIQGLDARANAELARIMLDFAHERRAAGRPIPHEIWRCVGPFAQGEALADLERVLTNGGPIERKAAALALAASPDPAAPAILAGAADLAADIAHGRLAWNTLS